MREEDRRGEESKEWRRVECKGAREERRKKEERNLGKERKG